MPLQFRQSMAQKHSSRHTTANQENKIDRSLVWGTPGDKFTQKVAQSTFTRSFCFAEDGTFPSFEILRYFHILDH